MNMIRKGQISGVERDILAQVEYARENFWSCCITRFEERRNFCCQAVFATQPFLLLLDLVKSCVYNSKIQLTIWVNCDSTTASSSADKASCDSVEGI